MRGTNIADVVIETCSAVAALPPDARQLLGVTTQGLFGSLVWWDTVLHHGLPPGAEPVFLTLRASGRVLAVVPLLRAAGTLASLTTPYSCVFAPALADGLDHRQRVAAMAALARFGRTAGIVRLDALPAEWEGLTDLAEGARRAGVVPLRFDHFGNWREDVAGLDWSRYLAARPGALRETIRRRLRRAERLPDARFALFTGIDDIDSAADTFESVYRRSWKQPEPFPTFNVALIRATAATGQLRLGVWSIGMEPVAVQFWVVAEGEATVLKLAHDEAFKAHSPGTVLTALMLRHLLDNEGVKTIDFGRGDDDYKKGWAMERRQRVGLLLANPLTPAGALAILRHAAGWAKRRRR